MDITNTKSIKSNALSTVIRRDSFFIWVMCYSQIKTKNDDHFKGLNYPFERGDNFVYCSSACFLAYSVGVMPNFCLKI
jgi:hypothetical protein